LCGQRRKSEANQLLGRLQVAGNLSGTSAQFVDGENRSEGRFLVVREYVIVDRGTSTGRRRRELPLDENWQTTPKLMRAIGLLASRIKCYGVGGITHHHNIAQQIENTLF
jgi:hypothetical protein